MDIVLTFQLVVAIVIASFVAYNVFHQALFLLVTQPKDASIGHELNQLEQRQLIEWNFIQHLVLWKYRLKMRTFVELERIIWRTSKVFVFGNPYNTGAGYQARGSILLPADSSILRSIGWRCED